MISDRLAQKRERSQRKWIVAVAMALLSATGCRAKGNSGSAQASADAGWAGISFVDDDYAGALARAKADHRLLFVDAWAPWCNTCLSMKAFVFGDATLAPLAGGFVWAEIDTEKPKNEAFLRKYPMKNWPTLWVIDPNGEKPLLKWAGSVTAPELVMLLESATQETSRATPGTADAAAAWVRGNHAAAEGRRDEAITEYESALARAPAAWSGRARTADALSYQLHAAKRDAECVALCLREWPSLPPGTSRLNVALAGLGCASALPEGAPEGGSIASLAKDATRLATDPKEPVLADDRSSLFETLVEFYRSTKLDAHDDGEALAVARKWRDFLDGEAARAPNAQARAVFDSHRMQAYAAVGEPEKAIAMLGQSERDFPDDYNPPARLAKVYLGLGRLDEALAAVRRAEAKIYGPRTLRVLSTEADIWLAMKKPKEAKEALLHAVELGDRLELPGGYRDLREQLRAKANTL
jgi:tetratricopeptide (TPR) repeat protein